MKKHLRQSRIAAKHVDILRQSTGENGFVPVPLLKRPIPRIVRVK